MKKTIAILLVFVLAISLIGCSSQQTQQETTLNYDQAVEKLNAYLSSGTVTSSAVTHMADPSWVGNEDAASELPGIDKYPLSISGSGQINIEIFSSTEKSNAKTPGWLDIQAQAFNAQHNQIDGQTVSVSIRPIASGLAFDYIRTQTYVPEAYTPANDLWGSMIEASGVQLQTVSDRLTGNVAGILMEKSTYDSYIKKYGSVTIENVVKAVMAGDIMLGHTDPNVSSTGLNIYVHELRTFDPANPFSDQSISALRQFEALIPPASPTTAEMAKVAQKGILNAVIMESQAFAAFPELSNWVFSPCGVRHDSPLFALSSLASDKLQGLQLFSDFCKSPAAQKSASSLGFNQYDDYQGADSQYTGAELISALKIWKENKDGGKPVISVFVIDRSGSMDGSKLTRVKEALRNSMQYVNESNYVGLVSYSSKDDITIDLPIGQFNAKQQSLFAGAVNDFKAAGGTATNSALTVALDMALKQMAVVADAKIRILIMSDGEQNDGLTLYDVKGLVNGLAIPVYGIGFEATLTDLQQLADINEGYCVNADSEDVIYKLKGLFMAQL
jgi:Ca-activated chloride channel family protein